MRAWHWKYKFAINVMLNRAQAPSRSAGVFRRQTSVYALSPGTSLVVHLGSRMSALRARCERHLPITETHERIPRTPDRKGLESPLR